MKTSEILPLLQKGQRFARANWNGTAFVYLYTPAPIMVDGTYHTYLPQLLMVTSPNQTVLNYQLSTQDLLADDWREVFPKGGCF